MADITYNGLKIRPVASDIVEIETSGGLIIEVSIIGNNEIRIHRPKDAKIFNDGSPDTMNVKRES